MAKNEPMDKEKYAREKIHPTRPPRLKGKVKNAKSGSKRGKKRKSKQ